MTLAERLRWSRKFAAKFGYLPKSKRRPDRERPQLWIIVDDPMNVEKPK